MTQRSEAPAPGLRERKKAKTRAAIQRHAVRLFAERGYATTTVEQVAEAAEVSASTVFRYFPTKEDLVISDEFDPLLVASVAAQPPELSPIEALRAAIRETIGAVPADDIAAARERTVLVLSVPELWGASLANMTATLRLVAEAIAGRVGRAPDDPAVRSFTGAAMGVIIDVMLRWADDSELDVWTVLDEALAYLGAGLPL